MFMINSINELFCYAKLLINKAVRNNENLINYDNMTMEEQHFERYKILYSLRKFINDETIINKHKIILETIKNVLEITNFTEQELLNEIHFSNVNKVLFTITDIKELISYMKRYWSTYDIIMFPFEKLIVWDKSTQGFMYYNAIKKKYQCKYCDILLNTSKFIEKSIKYYATN